MGLLTTTVGSFPKPADLVRARRAFAEGEIEEPALLEIERRATRETLALQAELGLDLFVTGDMDRDDGASFFADRIEGMEIAGIVRAYGNNFVRKPRIVDAVRRREPATLPGWKLAREAARKPVKAVLPGPYSLMDASFDEHYDSREECAMALAEVIRQEAHDLAAAGASDLQIDETSFGVRPEEAGLALSVLKVVVQGLRGKIRTWVRVCSLSEGVTLEALNALPVDGISMPLTDDKAYPALRALAPDKLLVAGVVRIDAAGVESEAVIRGRIDRLLGLVPAERLFIQPDRGLANCSLEEARAKLVAMVGAAHRG